MTFDSTCQPWTLDTTSVNLTVRFKTVGNLTQKL